MTSFTLPLACLDPFDCACASTYYSFYDPKTREAYVKITTHPDCTLCVLGVTSIPIDEIKIRMAAYLLRDTDDPEIKEFRLEYTAHRLHDLLNNRLNVDNYCSKEEMIEHAHQIVKSEVKGI